MIKNTARPLQLSIRIDIKRCSSGTIARQGIINLKGRGICVLRRESCSLKLGTTRNGAHSFCSQSGNRHERGPKMGSMAIQKKEYPMRNGEDRVMTTVAVRHNNINDGASSSSSSFTHDIALHAQAGAWENALRVLNEMESTGTSSSAEAYDHCIKAVCSRHMWQRALKLLSRMQTKNVDPPRTAYAAIIDACCTKKYREWEVGLHMLEAMKASSATATTMPVHVNVHVKGNNTGSGINKDRRDIVYRATRSVVRVMAVAKEWEAACRLMRECEGQVDRDIVNAVLTACGRSGEWERALAILVDMPLDGYTGRPIRPDAHSYVPVMASMPSIERAMMLFRRLSSQRIKPDNAIYCTLITHFGNAHMWEHALALFQLIDTGLEMSTNKNTRKKAESSSSSSSNDKKGHEAGRTNDEYDKDDDIHAFMKSQFGRPPVGQATIVTVNATLSALQRAKKWEHALALLDAKCDLVPKTMSPPSKTEVRSIDGHKRSATVTREEVWHESMHECQRTSSSSSSSAPSSSKEEPLVPNQVTVGTVIATLDACGELDTAVRLYRAACARWGLWDPRVKNLNNDNKKQLDYLLDLHRYTASVAKCAIRVALEDAQSEEGGGTDDLIIVFGRGHNSKNVVTGTSVHGSGDSGGNSNSMSKDGDAGERTLDKSESILMQKMESFLSDMVEVEKCPNQGRVRIRNASIKEWKRKQTQK